MSHLFFLIIFQVIACLSLYAEGPRLNELQKHIGSRLAKIDELKLIAEKANELGVRVFLQGGAAASVSIYVDRDVKREKGDKRYPKERFDYTFDSVFWPGQDIDLVVDGSTEKIVMLRNFLNENLPYRNERKSLWDLHSLRDSFEDRPPLIGNPDFLKMNHDSISLGMVEITAPKNGEPRVRDLRDWDGGTNDFLSDVHDERIQFLPSKDHHKTERYREGKNPPILSAIRFLNKMSEHGLDASPSDLKKVQDIIDKFDPKKDVKDRYVVYWLEQNLPKMFERASDLESIQKLVKKLGLDKKISSLLNDNVSGSFSWWMDKKPLPSKPVGKGKGKTAAELKLTRLTHSTKDFASYRSLTQSPNGLPNAFISRDGSPDEKADYGNGHYTTSDGRDPWHGSYLVNYQIKPNAREKTDFEVKGNIVLIHNRNAIEVIPEVSQTEPESFLKEYLATSDFDRPRLATQKSRFLAKIRRLSKVERDRLSKFLMKLTEPIQENGKPLNGDEFVDLFLDLRHLGIVEIFPEIVSNFVDFPGQSKRLNQELIEVLSIPGWENRKEGPEFVKKILYRSDLDWDRFLNMIRLAQWKDHEKALLWVEPLAKNRRTQQFVLQSFLADESWSKRAQSADWLINMARDADLSLHQALLLRILTQPHWISHTKARDIFWATVEKGADKFGLEGLLRLAPVWNQVIADGPGIRGRCPFQALAIGAN